MDYRHELKFLVTEGQLAILKAGLSPLLKQDVHQNGQAYRIRSLYFDDLNYSCMRENEAGVDHRKKYRIRIYNEDASLIKLEKKIKCRGMTRKVSSVITKDDSLLYMSGQAPSAEGRSELEKEMYVQIKANGMRPVCIVEYERSAFIDPRGNVRITFDRNICGCDKSTDFLEKRLLSVPLLPPGQHVLEVKYDELLPQYIAEVLHMGTLQRTAFSKYYYAGNYKNK